MIQIKIAPCKDSKFISNMQEISDYFAVRKKIQVITNTTRLTNILKIYFETLIYYIENSPKKYIVNIGQKQFRTQINGQTEAGKNIALDLTDISDQIITNVISDLAKTLNTAIFGELIILLNSIVSSPRIHSKHKISILNSENNLPQGIWYALARQLPEKLALETIDIRKKFIFLIISSPQKHLPDEEHKSENLVSVHNAFELYIKTLLRIHIFNNHYDETNLCLLSSIRELTKEPICNIENLDKTRLISFLLTQLVLNNNLFQIERKDHIREIIEEYSEYLEEDTLGIINEGINFNPENFDLGKLCIDLVEPNFSAENLDKIKTVISFVVPFVADRNFITQKISDRAEISFFKIKNVFQDPIYSFIDSAEMSISGLPLTFFSDSIGTVNNATRVDVTINQFYHPDFELIENKVVPVNLEKEEAKRGGRYFPHKDQVLELLWELQKDEKFPFQIKQLNSDFISNYLVTYLGSKEQLIHHKVFTITNFDSYFNAKNRFLNNINSQYLSEDIPGIRAFILDTKIHSKKSFLTFCYQLLEITLKKSIEFGGLNNSFWENKTPITEPNSQPIIYNQIRYLAEIKGIRISREIVASNGSLDFHFSYTKNDVLMNVCVELKNAHHRNIEHGITAQLPLYIKDVGSREGIFLILWYKSEEFSKPAKFNNINDLESYLLKITPKKLNIKTLIIDCAPKISPSLKSSEKRLERTTF